MFVSGFIKSASTGRGSDDTSSSLSEKIKSFAKKHKTALIGTGTAAATYGLLRHGKKTKLRKVVMEKDPKTFLGRMRDRMLYAADDVAYSPHGYGPEKGTKLKKYEGTTVHLQPDTGKYFKSKHQIGDYSSKQQRKLDDKWTENRLLRKYDKKHTKASLLHNFGMTGEKLKKMLKKYPKLLVKPRHGFASGVGGGKFLNEKHYIKKKMGGRLNRRQLEQMRRQHGGRAARKYMVEERLNIKKDPITGASREVRVHAIGGKVIPGASVIRGKNVTDLMYLRSAEKHFQKVLNKLPKKHKPANMVWAPDVAITDKGMKVIETNRGAAMSGFLDPRHMYRKHGIGPAAGAMGASHGMYKHITGRHSAYSASLRGAAAGGAAAGASKLYDKYKKEKEG